MKSHNNDIQHKLFRNNLVLFLKVNNGNKGKYNRKYFIISNYRLI